MSSPASLLVLCTGNICRSPMAEAYLRKYLPHTRVSSAGLAAVVGSSADPHAQTAMDALGISVKDHVARQLTSDLLAENDLVFVMTLSQKSKVESQYPWARGRVFRLGEWDRYDIEDPIGRDLATFERIRDHIVRTCDSWLARLAPPRHKVGA